MSELTYIDRLLPGFARIGFAAQLNALLSAHNLTAVRSNLAPLGEKMTTDGLLVTVDHLGPDLLVVWNDLCDALNADPGITIPDYANCQVTTLVDLAVKWNQMMVALDREAGLSGTYAVTFGPMVVPYHYQ